jgi:hypothetical protein
MGVVQSITKSLMEKAGSFSTPREFIKALEREGSIAYHGTPFGGFEKFSMSMRGKGADKFSEGDLGKGIYLTKDFNKAQSFATNLTNEGVGESPYVHKVFVGAKNPFNLLEVGKKSHNFEMDYRKVTGNFQKELGEAEINSLRVKHNLTEKEYDLLNEIEGLIGDNWGDWDIKSVLKEKGYDSLIGHANEMTVFDSRKLRTQSQLSDIWEKAQNKVAKPRG